MVFAEYNEAGFTELMYVAGASKLHLRLCLLRARLKQILILDTHWFDDDRELLGHNGHWQEAGQQNNIKRTSLAMNPRRFRRILQE